MTKRGNYWINFVLIMLALFLIGCGGNVERSVTFYRDEAWTANMVFTIPMETLAFIGSVEEIDASLDEEITKLEAQGVDASWKSSQEDNMLIYTIKTKGEGLGLLNEVAFDGDASMMVVTGGNGRQIQFSYSMGNDPYAAGNNTLTLTGGEIVSSNGQHLDNDTVQWINMERTEAILTEKSRFSLGTLLFLLVLAVVIGGGIWFFQKQRQPVAAYPPTNTCTKCKIPLAPQAQFCPNCGQKQA